MPRPLENVVVWKKRVTPGHRIIPPHLKLAILSRGRIALPPQNVAWLLEEAVARGSTWPERLTVDLADLFETLPVTIELFLNQRPQMTADDIDHTLQAYLTLRRERHLLPTCFLLLFGWGTHGERRELERRLDVSFTRLYRRANVRPPAGDTPRYILLVYVCFPPQIARFIAPERRLPPPPPTPSQAMPPLEGRTSRTSEFNLRQGPTTTANSLGEQAGHVIPVRVLDKAQAEDFTWYQIELLRPLRVKQKGQPATLAAGTKVWLVAGGLELRAAPWEFFRYQLGQLENDLRKLPLSQRITRLRQMSHDQETPFDKVIGAPEGKVYKDSIPFTAGRWQLFRDYEATRAPDGRLVDIHHLLVGLDVLQRPEKFTYFATIPIGYNYAAATWAGDLGAGAADMTLKFDKFWEQRNPKASLTTRADHYFNTRAAEWDLLADVDAWGIHALRRPDISNLDTLLALYYEQTRAGGQRTLTTARQDALERFLSHYGFSYEYNVDIANYPALPDQRQAARRVRQAIAAFGRIWIFRREPKRLILRDESKKRPKSEDLNAMTALFLYWLEVQTIENGAEVPHPSK